MAAGVVLVGAGAVSASASELDCFSPQLVLPTTVDTVTTMILMLMATHQHTAPLMAMNIGEPTMATGGITPAIVMQGITPIVAITIAIEAMHIAE